MLNMIKTYNGFHFYLDVYHCGSNTDITLTLKTELND